ncbi:MarR family transcriptional regulator [Rhodobacteraceae bacterium NNCM2]|nr:MarR family transcriptional regulator [Coraliihabitans acroporae]
MYSLDPQANFGFLIHDVSRGMRAWFDARAQEMGLTRAQWRVLVHLAGREGLNQKRLAEILELDTVTLGRHIDRLERDGWLERRPDPADRRAWRLYLTEACRPALSQMEGLATETMAKAMQGISEAEQADFLRVLTRIKANISDRADEDPAKPLADTPPRQAAL